MQPLHLFHLISQSACKKKKNCDVHVMFVMVLVYYTHNHTIMQTMTN